MAEHTPKQSGEGIGRGASGRMDGGDSITPHEWANSAEWLRVTLSSIGDGVIATDVTGRVTFLNPVAQTLTGWTQEQAVSRDLTQVFHIVNQDTRAEVDNPALRALKDGVIVGLANHTILIAKDGSEKNIDDSAAPIRNKAGETAGSVLVFRDITERYAADRAIKEAKEYAQNILATQHEPFLVLDKNLTVVSANRAFYETFPIAEEVTIGLPIWDVDDHAWDIERLRELLEKVLPQDRPFHGFEVEHTFSTVGRKVMVLNATRVRTPGGHAELILLSIQDVTQRREAEQAVRDSEVRYRTLFETAKDGILIVDAKTGKVLDANPYIAALVGVEPYELVGKELWEIGLFENIEQNKKAFTALQHNGYVQYDDLPLRNSKGETVEVEFVSNIYPQNQHFVAQCNIRSIAERRLREQARILADEARRKDEFLAMLSHELRNPLAPIRSATHLLRLQQKVGKENDDQREARETIERQVSHLARLVNDLLEVSRVISGNVRIDLERLDMREVVQHSLQTVQTLADQRGHSVALSLPEEPVWVHADATRLDEIVNNLLMNAIKYTKAGGNGHINITLQADELAGRAVLRVRDNGDGLDPDLLRGGRLFDLFSQGKRTLDRSQGGLGVGLALVHRLISLQHGTVEAKSDGPGKGSEFIVRLPLILPARPFNGSTTEVGDERGVASTPGEASKGSEDAGQDDSGRMRIVVVEDNFDQLSMLARTLRTQGYVVQTAHNGPEGLRAALDWRPDIVLLDIGLPEMDGYEVARRLRGDPRGGMRDMRLIAISGYGSPEDVQRAKEAGFDAHMTKPVDSEELEKLIASPRTA